MTADRTQFVPTSIGPIACHIRGAGPVIVLLPANPGDARDYDAVVGDLCAPGRTVIRLDWPGSGRTPPAVRRAGAPELARALGDVLTALVPEGPLVLVGNSVGGYAAVRHALREPDRVAGLVLVAPGGFTRLNPLSRAVCRTMGTPAAARWLIGPLASLYTWRRTPVARAALRRAYATARDPARRATCCAVWRSFLDPEHDLRNRVADLRIPVLLTWGRGDPILPLRSDGRRAARLLPRSQLVRFWSGHEPHAEVPTEWLAAVHAFLAKL